jgi:tubulin--tyrosine ligase-like protein 12
MVAVPTVNADMSDAKGRQVVEDEVFNSLWRYMGSYRLGGQHMWYVMDEIGSAISHSGEPGVICVPFMHIQRSADPAAQPQLTPYSILWPTRDLEEGDSVERDFLPHISTPVDRVARLVDWLGEEEMDEDLLQQLVTGAEHYASLCQEQTAALQPQWDKKAAMGPAIPPSVASQPRPLTVWTSPDDPLRLRHPSGGLSHPAFDLLPTDADPDSADIVWSSEPIKGMPVAWAEPLDDGSATEAADEPLRMVNQFPYEGAFHTKSHLAREVARCLGQPAWWNPSFDLDTHLPVFVGEFLRRKREQAVSGADGEVGNVWIVKPSLGTRSMGHVVSDSLVRIIRLMEVDAASELGGGGCQRVAQLYVDRPLLWHGGRKFDMRFMVAVRAFSAPATELYVHDAFWSRISNKPHDQSAAAAGGGKVWEDREAAMTAMWVLDGVTQQGGLIPDCADIIVGIEEMYPAVRWAAVAKDIHSMLRQLFKGVSAGQPNGMACKRARALYGVDVILDVTRVSQAGDVQEVQPKVMEVTFMPSNAGVNPLFSKQYPSFANDIFGCLFLGESNNMMRLL